LSPSNVIVSDVIDIMSRVSMPEIEPDGGTFGRQVVVSLRSFTPDSKIVYTIDSSEPTKLSTVYAAPFTLSNIGRTTVKAMGIKAGLTDSQVASATFVIQEQVAMPVFDPTLYYAPHLLCDERRQDPVHHQWACAQRGIFRVH
jgi:hypothetical protein